MTFFFRHSTHALQIRGENERKIVYSPLDSIVERDYPLRLLLFH